MGQDLDQLALSFGAYFAVLGEAARKNDCEAHTFCDHFAHGAKHVPDEQHRKVEVERLARASLRRLVTGSDPETVQWGGEG